MTVLSERPPMRGPTGEVGHRVGVERNPARHDVVGIRLSLTFD
jgi:hypothetical protein